MRAVKLRTEYLINPVGIDILTPRLQWTCENGITQMAYQLIAKDEYGKLLWNSDKVNSNSMFAEYAGIPLVSRSIVHWNITLWDENDVKGEISETATLEMGLLNEADWKAKWITGNYIVNKKKRYPNDCFNKTFRTENIKKARLYITACGVYEANINGKRVGEVILAPGITDYRKRLQYQTYDVTSLLQSGTNAISIEVADGWYRGSVGAWGLLNQYGIETKIIAQLEITDTTDKVKVICTDDSFEWSNDGPILFADNKDGEIVDARKVPSFKGKAKITNHDAIISASNNVDVNEHETFKPKLIVTPSGKTVLDFGQNIAGYVTFKLDGKSGQKINIRFGEMLDANGEFSQINFQCVNKHKTTPLQEVKYTFKDGENVYKTKFAIFGFQYILVETEVDFKSEDFSAIAVYSSLELTGEFESSNVLLNKFVQNTIWSSKSNFADIPTDCPTRERHGWTGDAQIFTRTASYLFNFEPFARKFIRDMMDWQDKRGAFPQIAPYGGVDFYMAGMNGSVGWSDAGIIIPYIIWKMYNDKEIINQNYDALRRYAKFMISRCGKKGLVASKVRLTGEHKKYLVNKGQAYGEWAEPTDVHKMSWTDMAKPQPEVATAYTNYVMNLMVEIAESLGKNDDVNEYKKYADGTKHSYQALIEQDGFSIDTDRQAKLVRPLYFGLLNEKQTEFAKSRLIKALENFDWKIGTGFLSTPLILDVLSNIDINAAYNLLENEQMPGWLFMPKNGATTIWESWEGTEAQNGIGSLNHYSKGAVVEWLFRVMCGINVAGENHFIISPKPGGNFTFAQASYNSIYGKVTSKWKKQNDKVIYEIEIPANCTAEIILQGKEKRQVKAGNYIF